MISLARFQHVVYAEVRIPDNYDAATRQTARGRPSGNADDHSRILKVKGVLSGSYLDHLLMSGGGSLSMQPNISKRSDLQAYDLVCLESSAANTAEACLVSTISIGRPALGQSSLDQRNCAEVRYSTQTVHQCLGERLRERAASQRPLMKARKCAPRNWCVCCHAECAVKI